MRDALKTGAETAEGVAIHPTRLRRPGDVDQG